MQYLVVPLLAGVVRIADDLTAAAVIRGLGSTERPFALYPLKIRSADIMLLGIAFSYLVLRIFNPDIATITSFITEVI
ncbi:hypothetical protein RQN30_09580 [Arcanobacterium hippocoleae]